MPSARALAVLSLDIQDSQQEFAVPGTLQLSTVLISCWIRTEIRNE